MKKVNIQNIVYKEGDYYVAQSLNVDVSSFGKTRAEALEQLEEAVTLYFENEKSPVFEKISKLETFSLNLSLAA